VQPFSTVAYFTAVKGDLNANIAATDRGLAFGDGVFETLLLRAGKIPFLTWHLERLSHGLARLGITVASGFVEDLLNQSLQEANRRGIQEAIAKIIVTRGEGRGYVPSSPMKPSVIVSIFPPPEKTNKDRDGVKVTICQQRLSYQPALLGIKHLNRLDNVFAAMEIQTKNLVEGIMLDDQNNVVEAISRNLFAVAGDELITPDLQRGGIAGVMRRVICDTLAPGLRIPVMEKPMLVNQLLSADEVFLCNSITGIWPVISIDSERFAVGSITRKLQLALQQLMESA